MGVLYCRYCSNNCNNVVFIHMNSIGGVNNLLNLHKHNTLISVTTIGV